MREFIIATDSDTEIPYTFAEEKEHARVFDAVHS